MKKRKKTNRREWLPFLGDRFLPRCARVQTAPAVVQLLRELGDDATGAETGCRLAIERYAQQNCAYALKIR